MKHFPHYFSGWFVVALLLCGSTTWGQVPVRQVEWALNADPGFGSGNSVALSTEQAATWDIPVGDLAPGVHQLFLRVIDDQNRWSPTMIRSFLVLSADVSGDFNYLEWYLNEDPGFGNGNLERLANGQDSIDFNIDLTGIAPGVHQLGYRILDAAGRWSVTTIRSFLIVPRGEAPIVAIDYTYTDDQGVSTSFTHELATPGHIIDLEFDLDQIGLAPETTYEVCFQARRSDGVVGFRRCTGSITTFPEDDMPTSTQSLNGDGQIEVFPNPVADYLNIKRLDTGRGLVHFTIYDSTGKIWKQLTEPYQETTRLPVEVLPSGSYWLVVESGRTLAISKFIKL